MDVFYVDGDHSYEGAKRDLDAIRTKIKPSGLLIMNDYTAGDGINAYGVVPATHEFMLANSYEMTVFCLEPHMFCDVVLQRVGQVPLLEGRPQYTSAREGLLADEVRQLRESTSWRLTAPARNLSSMVRILSTKTRSRFRRGA